MDLPLIVRLLLIGIVSPLSGDVMFTPIVSFCKLPVNGIHTMAEKRSTMIKDIDSGKHRSMNASIYSILLQLT